ncbi:hypothetical protein BDQ12DRAFT_670903 [Crucibulum laeve]|uniref:Uncharacterized protein n=1 Tax=Crucibulum laeve TaxID=68775 RepID=A0A5C3LVB0_9AGAR|nr:hypothetical protein BDQ12DRAFT_670903 [Crucibulum laeve]
MYLIRDQNEISTATKRKEKNNQNKQFMTAKVFIPTLTHAFYLSPKPWLDWSPDSPTFIQRVQDAFDLCFTNYQLSLDHIGEKVLQTAYEQLKTKKLKIASDVLDDVRKFFEKPEFSCSPQKIHDYMHWALQAKGPAYYRILTPQNCMPPNGFLQSQFIHPTAAKFLGYVEQAFMIFIRGSMEMKRPQFSHENYGKAHGNFYKQLTSMSENHWRSILKFSGDDNDANDNECWADELLISAYHAAFYIPESLLKAQT